MTEDSFNIKNISSSGVLIESTITYKNGSSTALKGAFCGWRKLGIQRDLHREKSGSMSNVVFLLHIGLCSAANGCGGSDRAGCSAFWEGTLDLIEILQLNKFVRRKKDPVR